MYMQEVFSMGICASMMPASMTGLMMSSTVSSVIVRSGLCAAGYPAGIMGMTSHVRAAGYSAGIMGMASCLCAACQPAVMISMAVVRTVRIAVLPIVHVHIGFRTAWNTASAMAVLSCQRTAVDSAGAVYMYSFHQTARQSAVMISVSVVRAVRITVHPIVHMGFGFRTVRNTASAVAMLPCQHTALDSAKAVLVYFCLCTSRNCAEKSHLLCLDCAHNLRLFRIFAFRCCRIRNFLFRCAIDFQGTIIYCIGNNTACNHGNCHKSNG